MKNLIWILVFSLVGSPAMAKWSHESELGIVIVGGNTESRTESAKHESKVEWSKNLVKMHGQYVHSVTEDNGSESSVELWSLGSRYERSLKEKFSLFTGTEWDGNRDAGYQYRAALDVGGKYTFYKEKADHVLTELGYRFQYEQAVDGTTPPLTRSHFVRWFTEWKHTWTESASSKFWVEVLPDVSEMDNLQVNLEPSLIVVLSSLLSLKVAYQVKYDNVPAVAGGERIDSLYTTTLVAKY